MKIYVVSYKINGSCREDPMQAKVAGVFTEDKKLLAERVATVCGGKVEEIELNNVLTGYKNFMKQIYSMKDEDFE